MLLSSGQPNVCCTSPGRCLPGATCQSSLRPMPNFGGSRSLIQFKAPDQRLGQAAARALGKQRVLRAQFHAAREAVLRLAVTADAHVAGRDAGDRAVVVEHLGGGEARINLDAERFRLGGEPAADLAERDDEVAVVVHQRRHHEIRQPQRARRAEPIEAVLGDRGLDRRVLAAPLRQQAIEADRVDHRAGENVSADLRALLDHDDGRLGRDLLEADRGGKACRPGADDHDIEFHRLPRRQFVGSHQQRSSGAGRSRNHRTGGWIVNGGCELRRWRSTLKRVDLSLNRCRQCDGFC